VVLNAWPHEKTVDLSPPGRNELIVHVLLRMSVQTCPCYWAASKMKLPLPEEFTSSAFFCHLSWVCLRGRKGATCGVRGYIHAMSPSRKVGDRVSPSRSTAAVAQSRPGNTNRQPYRDKSE